MFCSNCGNQIPDTAQFCHVCGTKVVHPQPSSGSTQVKSAPASRKGKKSSPFIWVVFLLIVSIVGTSVFFNMSIPDIVTTISRGEPLRERGLYDLQNALKEREQSVSLRKDNWDNDVCSWSEMESFLRDYLQATPELYYVDIKNTEISRAATGEPSSYGLKIAYFDDLTTDHAAKKLEAAADSMLRLVPAGASDWETALYLHDALIRHVTYEEGPMDQTAYGALVDGKAVCMGYAMAYEYLLTKAGVQCDTVIGYADEFSAAMDGTIFQMAQHAWTIVTFEENGVERSYYIDSTWDDPDMVDAYGNPYISRRWFCVTQEDIDREGRATLQDGYDMSQWNLSDDAMNYYVYTGSVIDSYDLEEVTQIMRNQILAGSNNPTLRIADIKTYYEMSLAMEQGGDFGKLCEALGVSSCAYNFSYSYLGDGLLCFNLYLNYPD